MRFYRHIQTYVESLNLSGNFGVNGSTVLHQANNTARVSPFVIVPGNTLDEAWVKHNSSTGIEDGGDGVTLVVSRYKRLVRVSKESLHVTLRSLLDLSADFFVSGFLGKFACKINNRNIDGGNTEGHSSKLSLQGGDNLGYGLGSSSGRGDDVSRSSTSSTPVFTRTGVNNSLGGGHGVNSGHQSFFNSESVVDGLNHRGKSVGSTGSTGDEVLRSVVFLLVNTHYNGLGVILGRGRVNNLLGSSIKDSLGLFLGKENSGRFGAGWGGGGGGSSQNSCRFSSTLCFHLKSH